MDFSELRKTIEEVELVDGHAHNLVALDSNFAFIHAFSLAHGDAVASTQHSLPFKRNIRDIAELYGCKSSLEAVEEYRRVSGLESISSTCFKAARISTVIFDDGIVLDKIIDTEWHKTFTPIVATLVRVERLAEKILNEGLPDGSPWTLDSFTNAFLSNIAAYYFGLDINTNVTKQEAEEALQQVLTVWKPVLVANKNLVDYIFLLSLEFAQSHDLPMQIHTGFGDRGLNLRLSNPLYLHNVLEDKRFAKCRIVLLHTSYPFSKEASYLASLYSQVYLDFGLAIPKLSVHGMISAVKDLLEQAPLNKVMFSTDAYAFPELFYLGAKNARKVVFTVLRDSCIDGDITVPEAVEIAKDLFARNSINFYKISN
ncbi:glutamine synthetase [Trifolium repens]|nr:protein fluG [Trifolium repens]WJX11628.1 glutamine synthetase [Trifolium repens]